MNFSGFFLLSKLKMIHRTANGQIKCEGTDLVDGLTQCSGVSICLTAHQRGILTDVF